MTPAHRRHKYEDIDRAAGLKFRLRAQQYSPPNSDHARDAEGYRPGQFRMCMIDEEQSHRCGITSARLGRDCDVTLASRVSCPYRWSALNCGPSSENAHRPSLIASLLCAGCNQGDHTLKINSPPLCACCPPCAYTSASKQNYASF